MNPEVLGYETIAFIGLYLKDVSTFDSVAEKLRKIPEIVECHYTTGGYDMFIKVYAKNNSHLLSIIHDQLQPLGLSRSETIISFREAIKRQIPVPKFVEDEEQE
jgi:Lrp/AsnC family transcriptional regulator for asnA, asnC and gidA